MWPWPWLNFSLEQGVDSGIDRLLFKYRTARFHSYLWDQGSIMMVDDKFSIWDLMHSNQEDDEILQQHGLQSSRQEPVLLIPRLLISSGINEILKMH